VHSQNIQKLVFSAVGLWLPRIPFFP
jgi:hypothetical protein